MSFSQKDMPLWLDTVSPRPTKPLLLISTDELSNAVLLLRWICRSVLSIYLSYAMGCMGKTGQKVRPRCGISCNVNFPSLFFIGQWNQTTQVLGIQSLYWLLGIVYISLSQSNLSVDSQTTQFGMEEFQETGRCASQIRIFIFTNGRVGGWNVLLAHRNWHTQQGCCLCLARGYPRWAKYNNTKPEHSLRYGVKTT